GYITEAQLGFRLTWGDIKGAARLIQMISRRQGFGDLLAEGVKRAAEKLGSPAKDCAIYTERGAAPRGHDHRARWDEMLDTCTSGTGTLESGVPVHPTEVGQPARINTCYGEVGYDRKTGKPLPATLKALGLDWLARDLWGKKA